MAVNLGTAETPNTDHDDTIVENILNGRQIGNSLEQKVYEIFIQQGLRLEKTKNQSGSQTFLERIKYLKSVFDWRPLQALLQEIDTSKFQKSAKFSTLLREKGNGNYKEKKLNLALRAYTLAAVFAQDATKELALAYANRSAVLLQLNKFKEAQKDIEQSLEILSFLKDNDKRLEATLCERANKCSKLIPQQELDLAKKKDILEFASSYFQLSAPNEKIPNAQKFVQIQFTPDKGRHLIVHDDVPTGTVLLVDQPFVSVLNNFLLWEVDHCHNCYRKIYNGIPCKNCVLAIFCNKKCEEEACAGTHHFEDSYLPLLHALNAPHKYIQSLRILCKVGPLTLLNLWKTQDKSYFCKSESGINGFDLNGIYDTKSYLPIFNLISHNLENVLENGTSVGTINTMNALFLKHILKENSPFFEDIQLNPKPKKQFEDFIASLILRHLESIKYNAISQSKLSPDGTKSEAFATGVYPLLSLCNHSCDPNCAPVKQLAYLQTCLLSLKPLKKGDELFITYKPIYSQMKLSERQSFLADNYRFICNCDACNAHWGPQSVQSCSGGGTLILEPSTCSSCLTTDKILGQNKKSKGKQCHDCALKDVQRARKVQEMEQILFECHNDIEKEEHLNNLKRLPQVLDYFGRNGFQTHFPLYFIALDLYKRALVHTVSQL